MSKPRLLTAIAERLPYHHDRQPRLPATDEESLSLHQELENDTYNQPYYLLANSIQVHEMTAQTASETQRTDVLETIIVDAHDLAARVLPERISDILGIRAKHPDNIAYEYAGADTTPPLRALHLLLHAYDHTHDVALRRAVTYILMRSPPKLSELYREAFEYSSETGKPVMREVRSLTAYRDDMLDEKI